MLSGVVLGFTFQTTPPLHPDEVAGWVTTAVRFTAWFGATLDPEPVNETPLIVQTERCRRRAAPFHLRIPPAPALPPTGPSRTSIAYACSSPPDPEAWKGRRRLRQVRFGETGWATWTAGIRRKLSDLRAGPPPRERRARP